MNLEQVSVQLDSQRCLTVVLGDITREDVDVVVNAANRHLKHGGGVAGAIARAGGKAIQRESNAWVAEHGTVATGDVAMTSGGDLPAKWVIHVVGPVWTDGTTEPELLRQGVMQALSLADAHGLHSISLPAISSGIFGFPKDLAAEIIWQAAVDYLAGHQGSLREVRFCNIDAPTSRYFYEQAMQFAEAHQLELRAATLVV